MGTVSWKLALAVPTLSQTMMILLALILFALAAYGLRRTRHAGRLLSIGALVGAIGLIAPPLVDVARAITSTITVGEGGNTCGSDSATFIGTTTFVSACSDPLLITAIDCEPVSGKVEESSVQKNMIDSCEVGMTIQPSGECELECAPPT